jgi:Zn-dependent protease
MLRSWRIGSAFGIGLYLHWSFLLLPAFFGLYNLYADGTRAALLALTAIAGVFVCVVLHELGHALMGRVFGIGTRDITMYPIGGVARLERMTDRPVEELLIAVAGPLVNVVIAVGLVGGILLSGSVPGQDFFETAPFGEVVLWQLLVLNVMLAVFNMLPVFPMDGGRVLRSLLAMWIDRLRATQISVLVAAVFAVLFVVVGVSRFQPFLGLIGLFVLFLGQQELAVLRHRRQPRLAGAANAPAAVPVEVAAAPAWWPTDPGFSGFTWDRRLGVWVEWRDGQAVGAVSTGRSGLT